MNGTIPSNPQTDLGAGLFPPLLRAQSRIIGMLYAKAQGWPITIEQAKFELADAKACLGPEITIHSALLSDEATIHINTWRANLDELSQTAEAAFIVLPDGPIDPILDDLKELARRTFAISSILDADLVGLAYPATDPGRTP